MSHDQHLIMIGFTISYLFVTMFVALFVLNKWIKAVPGSNGK